MKKRTSILALLCFCLLLLFGCETNNRDLFLSKDTTEAAQQIQDNFDTFTNKLFCDEIVANTLSMHYTLSNPTAFGITNYEISLGNYTDELYAASLSTLENVKKHLDSTDFKLLTTSQQLTYDILYDFISRELKSTDLYLYQETLGATTGVQSQLPILLAEYQFYALSDIDDYLALLGEMKPYFQSILDFQEKKANAGLFMSDQSVDNILEQCSNFISDPDANFLIQTFDDKINAMAQLSEQEKQAYQTQNLDLLATDVIPAYELLIEGLTNLKGTGTNKMGLSHYEFGQDYYTYLTRTCTGSAKSMRQLKSAITKQREQDIALSTQILTENPSVLSTADSYTFDLTDPTAILEDLKVKIQKDYPPAPEVHYTVKYVHPSLEEYLSPAFYLTPPIDLSTDNSIYINLSSNYQKIDLYTTLAHEGYPGHMYQTLYSNTKKTAPIRSILSFSGFTEGWATYVEMSSFYFSDLDPDLASLLQKDRSILLGLYATMDIGIHYDGWTLEDTSIFLKEYGIENNDIVGEIYQAIIEDPANYLKYYIGYLEFLELQNYAKEELKDQFVRKDFHQAVLQIGEAPFDIVKKYLDLWIANYK